MTADTTASASSAEPRALALLKSRRRLARDMVGRIGALKIDLQVRGFRVSMVRHGKPSAGFGNCPTHNRNPRTGLDSKDRASSRHRRCNPPAASFAQRFMGSGNSAGGASLTLSPPLARSPVPYIDGEAEAFVSAVTGDMVRAYAGSDGLGLSTLVRKGELAPIELVETAVATIEKLNPQLNAVISKLYDMGRAAAKDVDRNAPFAGVPYLLKELRTRWKDAPVTGSSSYLRNVRADSDTEVVKRIKAAGFLLVGKSNAPENGWSLSTEPKLYGATFNPWRKGITPGGSSGGAAAAVASHMVPIAEATDAAGSIRVPASCCGVVGLKPTRGRLTASPAGDVWHGCAFAFCNTRTVRDSAAYLDAVAGCLPGDPYTPLTPDKSWSELAAREPKKLRIAFTISSPDQGPVDPHVVTAVQRTVSTLEKLGHDVEQHDLVFDAHRAWEIYTRMGSVQTAAFYDAMEPIVGRPVTANDVEPVTWATISRGRSLPAPRHLADVDSVRQFGRAIAADLLPYDVFITPTLTQKPRPLGYYDMSETDLDRFNSLWFDGVFMFPFNASGQPAISLPLHWSPEGDPIGVQLVGRFGDEATLLSLSSVLESEMPWRDRKPPICA